MSPIFIFFFGGGVFDIFSSIWHKILLRNNRRNTKISIHSTQSIVCNDYCVGILTDQSAPAQNGSGTLAYHCPSPTELPPLLHRTLFEINLPLFLFLYMRLFLLVKHLYSLINLYYLEIHIHAQAQFMALYFRIFKEGIG